MLYPVQKGSTFCQKSQNPCISATQQCWSGGAWVTDQNCVTKIRSVDLHPTATMFLPLMATLQILPDAEVTSAVHPMQNRTLDFVFPFTCARKAPDTRLRKATVLTGEHCSCAAVVLCSKEACPLDLPSGMDTPCRAYPWQHVTMCMFLPLSWLNLY